MATVGPLHAAQLVDAVAEEGDDAPALAPRALGLRAVTGGDRVALDEVGRTVAVVLELVRVDLALAAIPGVGMQRARLGQARLVDVSGGVLERFGRRRALAERRVDGVVARAPLCTTPLGALTIPGHRLLPLARLAVAGMRPAPLAVLTQPYAIGVVALGLVGLVVPALALLAREGDGDPDVSAGHACGAPSKEGRMNRAPGKGKPRTRREVGRGG